VPACLPPVQPAPHPGRYHAAGDPWPLYAALDRDTMWAEWRGATEAAIAPGDDERWVCTLDVDLATLDLRDPATRAALGVTLEQLTGPWSPELPNSAARRVTLAAHELGADAVVVPSAARAGGWNLAVLPAAFGRVRLVTRRRSRPPTTAGRGPAVRRSPRIGPTGSGGRRAGGANVQDGARHTQR
jgi:RES domain-containing protein